MAKLRDMKTGEEVEESEPEVRLSQNLEFLGLAFSYYLKGLSLANITRALTPQYPTVNERTLGRISQNNGWEKSRAAFQVLWSEAYKNCEGLLPQIIIDLQRQKAQLEARPMDVSAGYLYRTICEDLLMYTGKHPKLKDAVPIAVSTEPELQAFIEALQEVLGPVWKAKRSAIEKAYRDNLEKATSTRQTGKGAKHDVTQKHKDSDQAKRLSARRRKR